MDCLGGGGLLGAGNFSPEFFICGFIGGGLVGLVMITLPSCSSACVR